jgi:hypothetical protein
MDGSIETIIDGIVVGRPEGMLLGESLIVPVGDGVSSFVSPTVVPTVEMMDGRLDGELDGSWEGSFVLTVLKI